KPKASTVRVQSRRHHSIFLRALSHGRAQFSLEVTRATCALLGRREYQRSTLCARSERPLCQQNLKEISIMSKMKNTILVLLLVLVCMVTPALADGCKTAKIVGSYVRSAANPDLWGDGSGVAHTNVVQLNLNSDGTAYEQQTGFPDILLSSGTG